MVSPVILCPLVHTVDFASCDPAETDALANALREGKLSSTKSEVFPCGTWLPDGRLDLCKQALGIEGARRVAQALSANDQVNSLLLGTNALGDDGACEIAQMAGEHASIETLYLGCNRISARGVSALREAITANPRLRSLWLKRNPLGDAGVIEVAALLRASTSLQVLDLVNCGMGETGFDALLDALSVNRSLQHLYIGGNGLQPGAGQRIADALTTNATLRHLYLDVNHLGDIGASALSNTALTTLSLASNSISAIGVKVMCHGLPKRFDLSYTRSSATLQACANSFGDEGLDALGLALPNSAIEELRLGNNAFTPAGVERFLGAVSECKTLLTLDLPSKGMPPWTRHRLGEMRESLAQRPGERAPVLPSDIRSVYR